VSAVATSTDSPIRELIIIAMPRENYEAMFDTMVRWARFGNLFAYEEDSDRLSLQ